MVNVHLLVSIRSPKRIRKQAAIAYNESQKQTIADAI